jgi:carboxymethylenebutenolidase
MLLMMLPATAAVPDTVRFPSGDGSTELVGYVYAQPESTGRHPAVVLLHGRAGVYSSLKRGVYTAQALSARHRMWGEFWAGKGYVALLVDSFGPRGYGDGFPKHSYSERPPAVSEQTVRPLDAYGALAYLRSRADVAPDRVGVHGWSNGGMTVLSAMDSGRAGSWKVSGAKGFAAAITQYPGCRTQSRQPDYRPYAPLLMLLASEDDEVSPVVCRQLAAGLRARGEPVEFVVYEGAHHAYDDPGKTKQSHAANREALRDSLERAEAFFKHHLGNE